MKNNLLNVQFTFNLIQKTNLDVEDLSTNFTRNNIYIYKKKSLQFCSV